MQSSIFGIQVCYILSCRIKRYIADIDLFCALSFPFIVFESQTGKWGIKATATKLKLSGSQVLKNLPGFRACLLASPLGSDSVTLIVRPPKVVPARFSIAPWTSSGELISTNAKPLACPVSLLTGILTSSTVPIWENTSRRSASRVSFYLRGTVLLGGRDVDVWSST